MGKEDGGQKEEVGKEDGGQKEEPETVEVKETDKREEIEKKEEIGEDKVEVKPVEDTTKEDKDDDVARRKPRSLLQKVHCTCTCKMYVTMET